MVRMREIWDWIKAHKAELITAGLVCVGTILLIKNWGAVVAAFEKDTHVELPAKNLPLGASAPIAAFVPKEITDNLTGTMLTATQLGEEVMCSAQSINKRIVAAGLAIRIPSGDYVLTAEGRLIGTSKLKTTRAGYAFTNIEWDKKVLDLIFNPEELAEIATRRECVKEIFARTA